MLGNLHVRFGVEAKGTVPPAYTTGGLQIGKTDLDDALALLFALDNELKL